eukprot:TRINITY_DN27821_c0_g1_i2.p1 TRINITY_DN27821_c0_g1~~TRINITY_DN27821_c0_g1_i2.p1  ORF type:complete len:455 (+),score=81.90 TRINITY_DN27821_c0_g1_i2:64-1428(+)
MDRPAAPEGSRRGRVGNGGSTRQSSFIATELCKFFQMNSCTRGKKCNFAHTSDDLKEKPDLYRTKLCADFMMSGACRNAEMCRFAHGKGELRSVQHHGKASSSASSVVQGEYHGVLGQQVRSQHGNLDVLRARSSFDMQARAMWNSSGSIAGKANEPLFHGKSSDNEARSGSTAGKGKGALLHGKQGFPVAQRVGIDRTPSGISTQVQRNQLSPQNAAASSGSQYVRSDQALASQSLSRALGGSQQGQTLHTLQQADLYAASLAHGLQPPQGLSNPVLERLHSLYLSKQVETLSAAIAALEGAIANSTFEAAPSASAERASSSAFVQKRDSNAISTSPEVAHTPGLVRTASSALNDCIRDDTNLLEGNDETSTEEGFARVVRKQSHVSSAEDEDRPLFPRQHTEPPVGSRRIAEQHADMRCVVVKNTFIDVAEENDTTTFQDRRSSSLPPVFGR